MFEIKGSKIEPVPSSSKYSGTTVIAADHSEVSKADFGFCHNLKSTLVSITSRTTRSTT